MKLLLWAAIIFGVIWVLRNKKKAAEARMARSDPSPVLNEKLHEESGEPMLSCAHCGIHFPSSEAVVDTAGTVYCGTEHRRLHATR